MSEDQELDYVNVPGPTAERHITVHSGRRLMVTVLTVAVVLAVALIVAYIFDGVALFLHTKECTKGLQTTTNTTAMTATTAATASPVSTCPTKLHLDTGWELNGTKCYYFSTNKLSWIQSVEKCKRMNGNLVKIDSSIKQRFLYGKLRNIMTDQEDKFWIGLTDSESEGVWKWTDGSLLHPSLMFWFTRGQNAEPDNWPGHNGEYPEGEDCALMGDRADGFEDKCWYDRDCNARQRFICEKKSTQSQDCQ